MNTNLININNKNVAAGHILAQLQSGIRGFLFSGSLLSFLFLTACDPVTIAIGGTALVGEEMVCNQEGIGGTIDDSVIQTKINKQLAANDQDIFSRIELSVKHGTVVVIGYMKNEEQRAKARNLISKVHGYEAIYYELAVGKMPSASQEMSDSGITSRIKGTLLTDGNVSSRNYDVTTVKGVAYINGTAQSKYERDVVIDIAKNTSGVKRVASYIRIHKKDKTHGKRASKK